MKHLKSCTNVNIHPEVLRGQGDITFTGLDGGTVTLQFSNTIPPHGSVYKVTTHSAPIVISNTTSRLREGTRP